MPMSAKISSEREQICRCFLDSLSMVLAQHLYSIIRLQNRLDHASRQVASSCFDHDLHFSSSLRCSSDDCSFVHRSTKVSSLPSRPPSDCRSISRHVRESIIDSQWFTSNATRTKRFSSILDRLLANPIHRWRNSCLTRNSSSVHNDFPFSAPREWQQIKRAGYLKRRQFTSIRNDTALFLFFLLRTVQSRRTHDRCRSTRSSRGFRGQTASIRDGNGQITNGDQDASQWRMDD